MFIGQSLLHLQIQSFTASLLQLHLVTLFSVKSSVPFVGFELSSALVGPTLRTLNLLVSSKLDFYNLHADSIENAMSKG
jgi:hypothetical protein